MPTPGPTDPTDPGKAPPPLTGPASAASPCGAAHGVDVPAGSARAARATTHRRVVEGAGAYRCLSSCPPWSGLAFLLLPLIALLVRAPWRGLPEQLASAEVWQALRLSLMTAPRPRPR